MRLTKSLLCGISALVLATGTAFAGQDSTMESSVENGSPRNPARCSMLDTNADGALSRAEVAAIVR